MSKSKKSSKSAKVPQPMRIKKEKLDEDRALHSMAHFVDDRVELVKQVFGSLKTKTITNLAPEYLKEKDMDDIQELCLNELLCLSKKRLLSVINATKCPTDTESSEDSDVEAREEHISLEEISSESETENGEKSTKKTAPHSRTKKNPKKPNPADNKNGSGGQMSVLELLELQARARAIRSQLALEPVTKIEVDLDDDVPTSAKEQKPNPKRKKASGKETDKSLSQPPKSQPATATETSSSNVEKPATTISTQKIKLKRNFRKQNQDILEGEDNTTKEQAETVKIKKEKNMRSPSPDVIPIVPVPETLCISDSASDSEEKALKVPKETQSTVERNEETEDGEIVENEESNVKENTADIRLDSTEVEVRNAASECAAQNEFEVKAGGIQSNKAVILECKILNSNAEVANEKAADEQETIESNEKVLKEDDLSSRDHEMDADQNDDVISIEGGDLETEMSEHLGEGTSVKCSISNSLERNYGGDRSRDKEKEENDVISLDSSDNEEEYLQKDNNESWHARYLKSSKVNKVLAVSRLGKRVRDKLKTSKHAKRDAPAEKSSRDEKSKSFTSKHEEGSVEQYKELLELSHRKT